jgi:hypothetical protein
VDDNGDLIESSRCLQDCAGSAQPKQRSGKSKGYLIVTAALELSRNQVSHFYSERKNTQEMIAMMDVLRVQYRDCSLQRHGPCCHSQQ